MSSEVLCYYDEHVDALTALDIPAVKAPFAPAVGHVHADDLWNQGHRAIVISQTVADDSVLDEWYGPGGWTASRWTECGMRTVYITNVVK